MATPQLMFDPARLWTGSRPAARSAEAIIPAVVVLPLVALTIAEPSTNRAPSRAIASGAIRRRSRPGRVVPPPRRCAAERPGCAGERELRREGSGRHGLAGRDDDAQRPGEQPHGRGSSATGSPSA